MSDFENAFNRLFRLDPFKFPQIRKFEEIWSAATKTERERCAKLCDEADKSTHPADLANAIRGVGA